VVLLDRAESVRLNPDEDSYFALELSGGGTIGLVRRVRRHLFLRVCFGDGWRSYQLADGDLPQVIQGRVVAVVRQF
jgi:hypothetical protein